MAQQTQNDLVGLADILGHDSVAATQLYTRKSLSALQDEIEKVRFYS
jgi:site-specific recombinase XerC